MPISALDIAVLGITVISAVLAAVRGFAREVLGITAWIIAAAAALFLHSSLLPFTHEYISHPTIALVVTIAAIFIVTLLVMSLITVQISDLVLDSRIGAMDRTLGLIFGIARGFLISIIGWLLFSMFLQGKVPDWAVDAKSRPILESSSKSISDLFKAHVDDLLSRFHKDQNPAEGSNSEPPPETPPSGGNATPDGAVPDTAQ